MDVVDIMLLTVSVGVGVLTGYLVVHLFMAWRRERRARESWAVTELHQDFTQLRSRVNALELDLAKLRGRVVGAMRRPDIDEQLDELDQAELVDELPEEHALGANRRFGKST